MTANVSELKARLSAYLARVRKGETVVVCDRSTPIARLVPYDTEPADVRIEEAANPGGLTALEPIRALTDVDVVQALRNSRDQR